MYRLFAGNMSWDKEEFFENARAVFDFILVQFPTFWNYVLFNIDKTPITIGNLIFGFIFIIIGYLGIRFFVYQVDKRVLTRFDIDIPHRYTIKLFLSYFLFSILFLMTLYFVKVPLTVFTVLGGALALGIGFGAKNIMNNLLCGVVIVSEHPIRVGDLIEVDKLLGVVENIGFRATVIKSLDNTHILVPNSIILEHNILNWTLSDKVIRSILKVSVSYGSPVEKVKELLLKVAHDHKSVLTYNKDQSPIVFFSDFGDSGLHFELCYWIAMNFPLDLKIVASELRFEINRLFKEEGIRIPFPQRDVHIKKLVPVDLSHK
ncbi:MAG: mechanosensitive ion channel [Oligoflexia bacterium]|nr:mechanosensitive ion channel [Oligoflexia bacterium]